ncbi:hypothetical protein MML48_3g00016624 [Holotrichia oblita]|uniref:Uncharacterized protein n=1 Tax=Holotrichia oblita TaxID=644536 RepID=A0ACB9TF50_HOLOL|nr:hypothetical protein MML48_3g00016624 [Holotrichia oblita]
MGGYEREQQRLLKLMEGVLTDSEYDDEVDEEEEDFVETREEDSESEQDAESDGVEENGPYFIGKDGVTKRSKHMTKARNVRTKSINLVKHLPGVKKITKI